jgi:hypothetical protein
MKTVFKTMFGFLAILIMSFAIAIPTGIPIAPLAITLTGLSFVIPAPHNVAFVGLSKEVWWDVIMEGFWGTDTWLSELRDFDSFVENDIIHIAEAGIAPNVFINNNTYPIPVSERIDSHGQLTLDRYDTENTLVRNADLVELSYDKLTSVVYGHKQALRMKFMEKTAHAIAPTADSVFTPVIGTTGATLAGLKKLTFDDVDSLCSRFDEAEIPMEGRVLIMTPTMKAHLKAEDRKLYKEVMSEGSLFGFKLYFIASSRMPKYNKTTGSKLPYAAAPTANDNAALIAFHKDEVFRCKGKEEMFYSEKQSDPINRADIMGFAMRGLGGSIRNKGIATIYLAAA